MSSTSGITEHVEDTDADDHRHESDEQPVHCPVFHASVQGTARYAAAEGWTESLYFTREGVKSLPFTD